MESDLVLPTSSGSPHTPKCLFGSHATSLRDASCSLLINREIQSLMPCEHLELVEGDYSSRTLDRMECTSTYFYHKSLPFGFCKPHWEPFLVCKSTTNKVQEVHPTSFGPVPSNVLVCRLRVSIVRPAC